MFEDRYKLASRNYDDNKSYQFSNHIWEHWRLFCAGKTKIAEWVCKGTQKNNGKKKFKFHVIHVIAIIFFHPGSKKEREHAHRLCFRTSVNFLMEICVLHPGWNWACNPNNISAQWTEQNFNPGWDSPCNQALSTCIINWSPWGVCARLILNWKRSSGWLESWEGLLLVTDVSTTCAEAIFRVKW